MNKLYRIGGFGPVIFTASALLVVHLYQEAFLALGIGFIGYLMGFIDGDNYQREIGMIPTDKHYKSRGDLVIRLAIGVLVGVAIRLLRGL